MHPLPSVRAGFANLSIASGMCKDLACIFWLRCIWGISALGYLAHAFPISPPHKSHDEQESDGRVVQTMQAHLDPELSVMSLSLSLSDASLLHHSMRLTSTANVLAKRINKVLQKVSVHPGSLPPSGHHMFILLQHCIHGPCMTQSVKALTARQLLPATC